MKKTVIEHLILLFLCYVPFQVSSDTLHISSEQSGAFEKAEYIIEKTIIVPEDEKLKFLPGSKLFFFPSAGIKVYGSLICEGTKEKPIIFTLFTRQKNSRIESYLQWQGIIVSKNGKISFKHCSINNSLYGVKVPDTSSMLLFDKISFYRNDNQLVIGEVPVFSDDSADFSFPIPDKSTPLTSRKDKERKSPLFPILHSSFAAIAIGGAVAYGYFRSQADDYHDKYSKAKDANSIADYKSKRDEYTRYSNAGLACMLISTPALGFTVTINIVSKRKNR